MGFAQNKISVPRKEGIPWDLPSKGADTWEKKKTFGKKVSEWGDREGQTRRPRRVFRLRREQNSYQEGRVRSRSEEQKKSSRGLGGGDFDVETRGGKECGGSS